MRERNGRATDNQEDHPTASSTARTRRRARSLTSFVPEKSNAEQEFAFSGAPTGGRPTETSMFDADEVKICEFDDDDAYTAYAETDYIHCPLFNIFFICSFCCHRAVSKWLLTLCRERFSVVQLLEREVSKSNYNFLVSDLKNYADSFIIPMSAHDYGHAKLTPAFDLLLFCHVADIAAAIVILCENSTLYVMDDVFVEFNDFCLSKKHFSPKVLRSNTPINGLFFACVLATNKFTVLNEEKFLASGITSFHAMQEGAKVGFVG